MPQDDLFPETGPVNTPPARPKRQNPKPYKIPRLTLKQAIKLTLFENVHASKARREDIARAHKLFHRAQDKLIKTKVTKLFFN